MIPRATIDFETRSACSLRSCGAWKYSLDSSTEILCLAFRLPSWETGRTALWHPEFKNLGINESSDDSIAELVAWIEAGRLVEAHNAWFEFCIWTNILTPRFDWPTIQPAQWRCSAAKAAAHALPRGLEDLGAVLHSDVLKDVAGGKVMLKLAKPRKERKKERELREKAGNEVVPRLYHESRELLETLWAYCRQDVLAEESVSESLADLSPHETQMFLLDRRINTRGFQLDQEAVSTALRLIERETVLLNGELKTLTGGCVQKATQRAQMLKWLESEGCVLDDTQAGTLDDVLARPHDPNCGSLKARKGVEIMRALGRSSTAKYTSMANWSDPSDGRVRGGLLYHGATTGRWSGAGVQPHNFVRGSVKDMEALWSDLKAGDRPTIISKYRSVMEALSQGLRGAIVAAPGKQLYVADYASIEARVLFWLAEDEDALNIFRRKEDIYLAMAMDIYKRPITKADDLERQVGKRAILGLGYQMGASKFALTCETYGVHIEEDFAKEVVDAYRLKYWRVKQMWADQNQAAIDALHADNSDLEIPCGYTSWTLEGRFLFCTLPSGRRLAYPDPQLKKRMTPWGSQQMVLTYMGFNAVTRQWQRQQTYGGMIVENVTQAVARDVMAEAMLRCDTGGYPVVLSIHDEVVSESATGTQAEFERLVSRAPTWGVGLPIAVDGFVGPRYKK